MIEIFFHNLWQVFLDLSPSLLLGLLIAGLLYAYLPQGLVHRGMSSPNLRSVWRAVLVGVPLPLCSCGVLPAALAMRNEGASNGATVAFLISTPQTGVDSILVSASLLGMPFAIFKVVAAFVSGLIGGVLVNVFTVHQAKPIPLVQPKTEIETHANRLTRALNYALFDLLGAIDLWIIGGIVLATVITTLIPADYFAHQAWSQGIFSMLLTLAISVPLYVCTTGSVPIAASLIAAGMPLGSALVFLMAGPATNLATIGSIYHTLGGRILSLYLGTIISTSIIFGLSFDFVLNNAGHPYMHHHMHETALLTILATVLMIGLLLFLSGRRIMSKFAESGSVLPSDLVLKIEGMTCNHCAGRVKSALEGCEAVAEATPNLTTGVVQIRGEQLDPVALIQVLEQAGYRAVTS